MSETLSAVLPAGGSSNPAAPRRDTGERWWHAVVAVIVPTAAAGLHGLAYGRWIVDDAGITFAYARSLTEGFGPVAQSGVEPVEGWSNPAWLLILMLGRELGLFDRGTWFGVPDYVAFPKAVALLCAAGVFLAYYTTARALTPRPVLVTVLAGCGLAAIPSFVVWLSSGLENGLLAVVVTWLAALLARATARGRLLTPRIAGACGLLAAIAALTRPDGAIYAAAYPLGLLLVLRRQQLGSALALALLSTATFAVPFGTYLAWRLDTFGMLVPNTAVAKAQGLPDAGQAAKQIAHLVLYPGVLVVLLAAVSVGLAFRGHPVLRRPLRALLVPLTLALGALGILVPDWMGELRFATPIWSTGVLAFAVAVPHVWPRLRRAARPVFAGAMAVAIAIAVALFVDHARTFRAEPTVPLCAPVHQALEINAYADVLGVRDGSLLVPDVGGVALVSRSRILDLAGLIHHGIAERWRTGDMAGLRDDIFEARPTFMAMHTPWSTSNGLITDPRLASDYVKIVDWSPTDGVWVRRDLVDDPARLAAVRRVVGEIADDLARTFDWSTPRNSCGDLLTPDAAGR